MLGLSLCLLLLATGADSHLSGWVESPGYPHGYQPFSSLNWSRCAPPGYTLSLTLTHLDVEESQGCESDAIEIFSKKNLVAVLCGKRTFEELESDVNPWLYSSPGSCLSLAFRSDYSNPRRQTGFRGFYTVQDVDECEQQSDRRCTQFCHNYVGGYYCSCRRGYELDADEHTCTAHCSEDLSGLKPGRFSSPARPGPYPEHSRCSYTLSVEEGLQVELSFSDDFDIQQGLDGQCIDSLTVESPMGILGPFCGRVPPASPLLTHSNSIRIRFTSDGDGSNNGFTGFYRTRVQSCSGVVTAHSAVEPQRKEHHHGASVTVTCDIGHAAVTAEDAVSMAQYSTTCQKSGKWSPKYDCQPVNCGYPDIARGDILQLASSELRTLFGDRIQFKCSSHYYTLEGSDTYVCDASGLWVSIDGKRELPRCIEVCGKPESDILSPGMILGGEKAEPGEIPWQLFMRGPPRGAASLISDRWALTAAHVVDGVDHPHLYGGLVNASTAHNLSPQVAVLDVQKVIIHPRYQRGTNRNRLNFDNDIALIRMASRVTLGPKLLPVCLPERAESGLREGQLGSVSGWGKTEMSFVSQILRYAHISVYPLSTCRNTPTSNNQRMVFTENFFCAGAEGKDSCKGDSGGPFVIPMLGYGNKNNNGPYRLEGIVSWGASCKKARDQTELIGYYTKVNNYLDWINDTINKVEKEERMMKR